MFYNSSRKDLFTNNHVNLLVNKQAVDIFSFLLPFVFILNSIVLFIFYFNQNAIILSLAVIQGSIGVFFLFLHFFSKVRYSPISVFCIYLFLTILVFVGSSIIKVQSGVSMYYFPLLISLFSAFDNEDHRNFRFAVIWIILVLFLIGNLFDLTLYYDEEIVKYYSYSTSFSIYFQCLIFVSASFYIFYRMNEGFNQQKVEIIGEEETLEKLKIESKEISEMGIDALRNLAKTSDIQLILLFKILYPQFHPNLLRCNENLSHELFRLCIYIKLGFSTKDIAEYSCQTFRSVQTKKNRLRKTFNLDSSIDLYDWVASF